MAADRSSKSESIVAVVGLGKIGLPLAAQFAAKSMSVIGCDDWSRFRGLKVVFDGRGSIDPEQICRAGGDYLAVGVANTAAWRHA